MSTLTKEQLLKYAQAWQAFILLIPWYMAEFGIDTPNRLFGFVAVLIVFVILFLNRGETEKVAVAVGIVNRFLASQQETDKAKEVSDYVKTPTDSLLEIFIDVLKGIAEGSLEETEEPVTTVTDGVEDHPTDPEVA